MFILSLIPSQFQHIKKQPPRSPLYSKAVRWLCVNLSKAELYRHIPRNVYNQNI